MATAASGTPGFKFISSRLIRSGFNGCWPQTLALTAKHSVVGCNKWFQRNCGKTDLFLTCIEYCVWTFG